MNPFTPSIRVMLDQFCCTTQIRRKPRSWSVKLLLRALGFAFGHNCLRLILANEPSLRRPVYSVRKPAMYILNGRDIICHPALYEQVVSKIGAYHG